MPDNVAFKILTTPELETLERDGRFSGSEADVRDGYIHLSTADQLEGTLAKHYAGQEELHIAEVDLDALADAVKWEPARDGALFPHVYGDITLDAVVAYSELKRDEEGNIRLPVTG